MKLKVIGCSGAEFPGHNSPGFLLDEEILFDAGSLTNVLNEREQYKIRNIFITHAHLDHIRSIPFLADNIIVGKKKKQKQAKKRSPGRPKGSRNKDKTQVKLTLELLLIKNMVQKQLLLLNGLYDHLLGVGRSLWQQ